MRPLEDELFPSTPWKVNIERAHTINRQFHRCFASTASYPNFQSFVDTSSRYFTASWGGLQWEKRVRSSAQIRRPEGFSILVTGAAGFVGSHVSVVLRKRGDVVIGLDNFNSYCNSSMKNARLLAKIFDVVAFTHVMHLAAQAGVGYAMENPASYVHSHIAGLVTLLEGCKSADPQPVIVWAFSSVYRLASLYAATKKAGKDQADLAHHRLPRQGPGGPRPGLHLHRRHRQGLRRLPRHLWPEPRQRRQEARPHPLPDIQPGQHPARAALRRAYL